MNRKLITLILLIIILAGCIYIFINRKTVFSQVTTITYRDGCVEKFRDGVAMTKLCTNSRMQQEIYNQQQASKYNFSFNIT
jgi:hypothetical protein